MNQSVSTLDLPRGLIEELAQAGIHHAKDADLPVLLEAPQKYTAFDLLLEEERSPVSTGNPHLDSVLTAELLPGAVVEIAGLPGHGKTQLCLLIAASVKGNVAYVDTSHNFAPHRYREISKGSEEVLQRLQYYKASSICDLMAAVRLLAELAVKTQLEVVVIDSIAAPVRLVPFEQRTGYLYTIVKNLRFLAHKHKFSVLITNDMTTKVDGARIYVAPSFGGSFHHLSNTRMIIEKKQAEEGKQERFEVKVVKSCVNAPLTVTFIL